MDEQTPWGTGHESNWQGEKIDVDKDGKASGSFLRAWVAVEVAKAMRRGVLLKTRKDGNPEWFDIQYKKLPFYYLSCDIMGHSELECDKPVVRNDSGKLPYDLKLRAPETKKKFLSFSEAAAESFGSGTSSGSKQLRSTPMPNDNHSRESKRSSGEEEGEEVLLPLKKAAPQSSRGAKMQHRKQFVHSFRPRKVRGRKRMVGQRCGRESLRVQSPLSHRTSICWSLILRL